MRSDFSQVAILAVLLSTVLGCATIQPVHAAEITLSVAKRFRLGDESSSFAAVVHLPCGMTCDQVEDPRTLRAASAQLVMGLDGKVVDAAERTLRSACKIVDDCSAGSEQLWDEFYEMAQKVELEPEHSLDEYLSGLRVVLANAWGLERTCSENALLCRSITHYVVGAPEMISDLVVRDALLRRIGMAPTFRELTTSMGDMLEPVP